MFAHTRPIMEIDMRWMKLPFVAGSRLALSISSTSLDKDAFYQPVGADCGHRQRKARHRIFRQIAEESYH
jgi:hypothetical protein